MIGEIMSGSGEVAPISLVVVVLEDDGGSMTFFTCSARREAVLPPSVNEEDKASGELPGAVGRGTEI